MSEVISGSPPTLISYFGHANIIRYCDRPFDYVWEMDNAIMRRWNAVVDDGDIVIHLGDFSFRPKQYRDKLNGSIHLIKGNHDKDRDQLLFEGFSHRSSINLGENGDIKCLLSHRPINVKETEYDFVICGHVHEKWLFNKRNLNVGVDKWDFRPIHIDEVTEFLRQKRKSFLKNHEEGYLKR